MGKKEKNPNINVGTLRKFISFAKVGYNLEFQNFFAFFCLAFTPYIIFYHRRSSSNYTNVNNLLFVYFHLRIC